MTYDYYIKQRVVKIVNSRLKVQLRLEYDCDKDLIKVMKATDLDLHAISSLIEKLFSTIIQDEELVNLRSINDFLNLVKLKKQDQFQNLVYEHF